MKKNYLNLKDNSRRYKFNNFELFKLLTKIICYNRTIPEDIKFFFFLKNFSFLKDSSRVRIINRCVITNRSHSVLRFFKISRICLKENIGNNFIQGLRKSSW